MTGRINDTGNTAGRINLLLMTATITPGDAPELIRTDPVLRLNDYAEALSLYIDQLGDAAKGGIQGIVFVENSNSDIASLVDLVERKGATDRVEFIARYGRHGYPERHRSYGESRLLDHAMANSRLIGEAGDEAVIWKITGRYHVRNLAHMVKTAPRRFDLYCDVRNRPISWLDLRFMAWTRAGYNRILRNIADRLGEDPKEPVMHRYVSELTDETVVKRYRAEPLIDGVRGWDNQHYAQGRAKLKFLIRVVSRRLLPFLWI